MLAFYEELSHDEIAKTTGTQMGALRTSIRAALAALRVLDSTVKGGFPLLTGMISFCCNKGVANVPR